MLHWRILIGTTLVTLVTTLAYLDYSYSRPGLIMAPLALVGAVLAAGELVRLFESNATLPKESPDLPRHQALAPSRWVVWTGALVTVLFSFVPAWWVAYPADNAIGRCGWIALGLAVSFLAAVVVEMVRYKEPGIATVRLAQAVFAIVYAGGLMAFVVELRLLGGEPWGDDGRWGMVAILSLIAVVKGNDTGAYIAGHLFGKHKMTPVLSPGKTWEGALGGMALAIVAAALCLGPMAKAFNCVSTHSHLWHWSGVVTYGVLVGIAGIAGDLAISLLKRDAGLKNSSTWLPGMGGILDLLDSVLFGAPIAYLLWVSRVVGP